MDRPARFAGSWYPASPTELRGLLEGELSAASALAPAPAKALVLPHAGYRYSLRIAAPAVAAVEVPRRVVVLCPNHTVPPPLVSVWPAGRWETPLGAVEVDAETVSALRAACPWVVAEPRAHLREHAVELILPLLQARRPDLLLTPVVVAEPRYERLAELGAALAEALAPDPDALVIASSDMCHFLSAAEARRRDERALERLEAFDARGLLERCEREDISMCGVRPAVVALECARRRGAREVELVRYGHSGEVSGDEENVVAYASLVIR